MKLHKLVKLQVKKHTNSINWFYFTAMIKQFLKDVVWRDLDYLIIDTPPGTTDEHISAIENLKAYNPDGAILVTTPQVKSGTWITITPAILIYVN